MWLHSWVLLMKRAGILGALAAVFPRTSDVDLQIPVSQAWEGRVSPTVTGRTFGERVPLLQCVPWSPVISLILSSDLL